jgi:hypothetical protein
MTIHLRSICLLVVQAYGMKLILPFDIGLCSVVCFFVFVTYVAFIKVIFVKSEK